ncbi:hypothetical protein DH2020_033534 [Rehmannia glutinosa]|uniref:Uncharacterized protein n=1 Tax=Rehmannia glutinosa TaxID=99300 RepID=A0ABR0VC25_REHGL
MPVSSVTAPRAEPVTTLGFRHWAFFSAPTTSPLRQLKQQHGTTMSTTSNSHSMATRLSCQRLRGNLKTATWQWRESSTNSVIVSVAEIVEIGVNAVPITKEDDRVHKYQIPSDDCFSHLEVQFKFFDLSRAVEGVMGRTYRPNYESRSRLGVAMAVVGGENEYRTTTLFAADCKKCVFSSIKDGGERLSLEIM